MKKVLTLAALALLLTACPKDEKSGGGGGNETNFNPAPSAVK